MVELVSTFSVQVLADVVVVLLWTVGLFERYGSDLDWQFYRSPFDNRYSAIVVVTTLYVFSVLASHGVLWYMIGSDGFEFGRYTAAIGLVLVGSYFLFGPMYEDVDESWELPNDDWSVSAGRFYVDWIRGVGWTFLGVGTSHLAIWWTLGPVVW